MPCLVKVRLIFVGFECDVKNIYRSYTKCKRYTKGVSFLPKMVYKRVRGRTSWRSLPVLIFFKYPPEDKGNSKDFSAWGMQRFIYMP